MARQIELNLYRGQRGGRRPRRGRKAIHSRGVAHRRRERVNPRTPLHVNFKLKAWIRNKTCLRLLKRAILNGRRHGLRVNQFSLQSNHVHLIVEAGDNATLTRGMRSLTVTFAKGLKSGRVQLERYHLHVMRTLAEVRNVIHYVRHNTQKHTGKAPEQGPYASGAGDGPVSWLLAEVLRQRTPSSRCGPIARTGSRRVPGSWKSCARGSSRTVRPA